MSRTTSWIAGRRCVQLALFVAMGLFLLGCSSSGKKETTAAPLRVAVATDYPPIIFKQGEIVSGVEADMARAMGKALGRPIEFVRVQRPALITELLRGGADIVMSGLSETRARGLRVSFTEPYHGNALLALCRVADVGQFDSVEKIAASTAAIGAPRGTTSDTWVEANCPNARKVRVGTPDGGAFELRRRRIDCFIYDAHAIAWLVAENESQLAPASLEPLEEENLAWAVRRSDTKLLDEVNSVLAGWRADGTLEQILRKWLSYYDTSKDWGQD